jgi:hypothetical protein
MNKKKSKELKIMERWNRKRKRKRKRIKKSKTTSNDV